MTPEERAYCEELLETMHTLYDLSYKFMLINTNGYLSPWTGLLAKHIELAERALKLDIDFVSSPSRVPCESFDAEYIQEKITRMFMQCDCTIKEYRTTPTIDIHEE